VWQLLACANAVVIPGLRVGTYCAVLRGSLLIVCKQVRFFCNKELLYFLLYLPSVLLKNRAEKFHMKYNK